MRIFTTLLVGLLLFSCDSKPDAEVLKAQVTKIDFDKKLEDLGIELPPSISTSS